MGHNIPSLYDNWYGIFLFGKYNSSHNYHSHHNPSNKVHHWNNHNCHHYSNNCYHYNSPNCN